MKMRIKKRWIYCRHQAWCIRMTAEEQAWLNLVPVGREFGSKDYERLAKLDALAELATTAANRISESIDRTVQFVEKSNARIRAMDKPN